jgi:hypothetical protein
MCYKRILLHYLVIGFINVLLTRSLEAKLMLGIDHPSLSRYSSAMFYSFACER